MKQTLRIAIPLVVLVAVVFAATYFARYTRKPDEEVGAKAPEPPLRFGASDRFFNPDPLASLQNQLFQGFYEPGSKETAAFWFENRNTSSVTLRLQSINCDSCSGGRVTTIPPELTRQLMQMSAIQVLPQGLVSGLPTGFVGPAANFAPDRNLLKWQSYDFKNHPHATFNVSAAANSDGWTPQWGILELLFSPYLGRKKEPLTATFDVHVDGSELPAEPFTFKIAYEGVDPFGISQTEIDIGEINEATAQEMKLELIIYSCTRGPESTRGDLAAPVFTVDIPAVYMAEAGPFVTIGTPIRFPEDQLEFLMRVVSTQRQVVTRVLSAYRVPIIVRPRVGEDKLDLGPLERIISLTVPNTDTSKTVTLRGIVRGGVWLDADRREIKLADTFKRGTSETYRLITDKPDAELTIRTEECTPAFMQVALEKLPPAKDRGYYDLKIRVPNQSKSGPWNGIVVLELKGARPQRIRIPVIGKGG